MAPVNIKKSTFCPIPSSLIVLFVFIIELYYYPKLAYVFIYISMFYFSKSNASTIMEESLREESPKRIYYFTITSPALRNC
jgi:hypothetical protein